MENNLNRPAAENNPENGTEKANSAPQQSAGAPEEGREKAAEQKRAPGNAGGNRQMYNSARRDKEKNKKWIIILIAAIVVLLFCLAFIGVNLYRDYSNKQKYNNSSQASSKTSSVVHILQDSDSESDSEERPLVENPIDFKDLQAQNPDIYGWITVPNTNVDYPLLQHPTDDNFYLEHDAYTKYYLFAGAIYSQASVNGKDFKDPNTLLYGHNMLNGSMFATLHRYESQSFLDENPYFYIYIPGHILKYEIFSAYEYDDRHIMYSFDFSNKNVFKEYLEMATNPNSIVVTKRDVKVTTDDTIVTLSTCTDYRPNNRYLVQGVLIDDQATK